MVEYGQGVGQSSGQVPPGGSGSLGGGSHDVGAQLVASLNDAAHQVGALPLALQLLLLAGVLVVGFLVLKRVL